MIGVVVEILFYFILVFFRVVVRLGGIVYEKGGKLSFQFQCHSQEVDKDLYVWIESKVPNRVEEIKEESKHKREEFDFHSL